MRGCENSENDAGDALTFLIERTANSPHVIQWLINYQIIETHLKPSEYPPPRTR